MELITDQRVKDENLKSQYVPVELDPPQVIDGETFTYAEQAQVIDAEGNVYLGIVEDTGAVTTNGGYTHYDSVATLEGLVNAEPAGMSKRFGKHGRTRHTMYYNPETRQVFVHAVNPSASDDYNYSMDALDVAEWLFDVDNREEPIRYDDEPKAFAVGIPLGIVAAIEDHLPGNSIDWMRCILAEALGDIQLAGAAVGVGEGAPAFTAEQVREALQHIREPKPVPPASSDRHPDEDPPVRTEEEVRAVIERIKAKTISPATVDAADEDPPSAGKPRPRVDEIEEAC